MPIDIRLTEDRRVSLSEATGDFDTVSGDDNVFQQLALATFGAFDPLLSDPVTDTDVAQAEAELRDAFRRLDYADDLVALDATYAGDGTLDVSLVTRSEEIDGRIFV